MDDTSSSPLGLSTGTWITLAIAFMGVFALKQNPFHDSRPPDHWNPVYSHPASEDQDVEARLWQDPLAAVETARSTDSAAKKPAPAPSDSKPSTNCSEELGKTPPDVELIKNVHSAQHLCAAVVKANTAPSSVLVIGAMVSGAPYAADIEDRRRARYAVLAGLYRSDYMPMNSSHVGYVHLMDFYGDPAHANDLAAFEWFVDVSEAKGERPAKVLLLWLDQDGFRTKTPPIAQLSKIADGIMPTGVPVVLLGPADSDGLRDIVAEFKGSAPPSNPTSRRITIYSPRATAATAAIMPDGSPEVPAELSPNIHLYRTIATDRAVANSVRAVLNDRHVQMDEIALVAERDTLYGRSMGDNFNGCANPPSARPDLPPVDHDKLLHPVCLSYLRGLDGIGPPPPKRAGSSAAANANYTKSSGQATQADATSDASTGPGQLDYLRRMGSTLTALQGAPPAQCAEIKLPIARCHPRYIKAIGVLGTDIYDKLLILQELRPTFPDAILFTFDLDARLSDTANLPWTRDLLVASSLSLSLRQDLQADIPTFRDSYQSAIFYSTLLALHRAVPSPGDIEAGSWNSHAALKWTEHPQVFEIGRKRPLDLLLDQDHRQPCDFDTSCPSISDTRSDRFDDAVSRVAASGALVLVCAALWAMLRLALGGAPLGTSWHRMPVNLTRFVVVLAVIGALALRWQALWDLVLGVLTHGHKYMPAPIADGAGHWGKDLLEAGLVPLVFAMLIRGQRKLNGNADKMRTEFALNRRREGLIKRYASKVRGWPWRRRLGEWAYIPLGHLSNESDQIPSLGGTSPLESLIARYLYRGMWRKRWARVVAACVISGVVFKLMEWLGFSLFVGVPWFITLQQKHGLEGIISGLCFLFVQGLIFWVIDAILLTRAFMLDIARDAPAWPGSSLGAASQTLRLNPEFTSIWLNLRLISRRTTWVSNFIWYPSLVIAGLFAATFTVQYGQYRFDSNPITLVVSIGLIVTAVVLLRQSAENWRSELLEKLVHRRLALLAQGPTASATAAQIKLLINMVTELREGAFAPYSQQPLVRAVLLPTLTFAATAGLPFLRPG